MGEENFNYTSLAEVRRYCALRPEKAAQVIHVQAQNIIDLKATLETVRQLFVEYAQDASDQEAGEKYLTVADMCAKEISGGNNV